MRHNQRLIPAFADFEDARFKYDTPEHRETQWPSVPRHEPTLEETHVQPSLYEGPEISTRSRNHTALLSVPRHQEHASEQAYSEVNKPKMPPKSPGDRSEVPSTKHACHDGRPPTEEQEEAAETARDILGPRVIDLPTVQIILELQATQMDPMEWVSVKKIIEAEPRAGKDLYLLTYLLDRDARAAAAEENEKAAAVLQADELHQLHEQFVERWRELRRRPDSRS